MLTPLTLALTLLVGCTPINQRVPPTQTLLYECVFTDTALAPDDEALGTTPAALLAELDGSFEHVATWADSGDLTTAELQLTLDITQALLRESPGCGMAFIAIPATASVQTADGGFDAVFELPLEISEGGALSAWGSVDPAEVGGTWTPRALEPNESRRGIALTLERGDSGLVGEVLDETEGDDGEIAWAGVESVLVLDEGTPIAPGG